MIISEINALVTGGSGLIGFNLTKRLERMGANVESVGSEIDLRIAKNADDLIKKAKPNVIIHLAAKVGGILANCTQKASFYSDNILINTNLVNACVNSGEQVEYFLGMGTGCAYPKRLENEILYEQDYLDGIPEFTNDAYAYAKRGLLVHLDALKNNIGLSYGFCIPANIYGPHDNFHKTNSHVVPGLIRRFSDTIESKQSIVKIWGNGLAKRDFLYIDDCVDAIISIILSKSEGPINIATKQLTTITDVAQMIGRITGFDGEIYYDSEKPDGQLKRIFNTQRINDLGWSPKINLETGLKKTIDWYNANRFNIREK